MDNKGAVSLETISVVTTRKDFLISAQRETIMSRTARLNRLLYISIYTLAKIERTLDVV